MSSRCPNNGKKLITMKTFKSEQIVKAFLLIAASLIAFYFIPVPSAQTPHARMPLNDIVNRISAKCTAEGFLGSAAGSQPETHVEGARLTAIMRANGTGQPRVERLTFEFDNIFALGVRILAFIAAFIMIYLRQSVGWCRILLAVAGGLITLPILIFARDFLFGVFLTQIPADKITGWFDTPFRILIMIMTLFTPLVICQKIKGKEGK